MANTEGQTQEQSQEHPNSSTVGELQTKLQEQGAEMAQIKEQMANMAKMMENLTNMMQASAAVTAAATITPAPTVGERSQGVVPQEHPHQPSSSAIPMTQAAAFTQGPVVEEGTPRPTVEALITDNTKTVTKIGAISREHEETPTPKIFQAYQMGSSDYEPEEKAPEWRKEMEKLASEMKSLQGTNQRFTGNMDDLFLFPKVEVPRKFKMPDFIKFDGTSNPEHHLRAYCTNMGSWSRDENFLLTYFHNSLTGAAYAWYMKLDRATVSSWTSVVRAFLKHYDFNIHNAPTRDAVMTMRKNNTETFRQYAQKWRQLAMEVDPPMSEYEMSTYFVRTLGEPYYDRMITLPEGDFAQLIRIGEKIDAEIKEGRMVVKKSPNPNGGGGKKEGTINYIQNANNSEGANQGGKKSSDRPNFEGQKKGNKDNRPIPNFGVSHSELFRDLCKQGWMCPKPGRVFTAPFPPWYRADLTCEYHNNVPGHSIDTCDPFRWHVLSLIDANVIKIQSESGPNITTQPLPHHDKGKGLA